uniref:Golgin B1 n=1 Tax=Salarias fasciatus TaxID=181472 RepID=A0A672G8W1_SALFA
TRRKKLKLASGFKPRRSPPSDRAVCPQLRILQAVVFEKDVRFQEQIQKHEEELMRVTTQQNDGELQQALLAAQQRCDELEDALNSRSQMLEMLQQEVSSADQQKQVPDPAGLDILTAQFRQMEQELSEALKQREEDRQRWDERAGSADAELAALRASLEALEGERATAADRESELSSLREAERIGREALEDERKEVSRLEAELSLMKEAELGAAAASSEASERDRAEIQRLQSELATLRDSEAAAARRDDPEGEKAEVESLERELVALRQEQEAVQRKSRTLDEIWRHLSRLASEDVAGSEDESVPADPALLLDAVQSLLLGALTSDRSRCFPDVIVSFSDELDRRVWEQEEATAKILELEEKIATVSTSSANSEAKNEALSVQQHLFTLLLSGTRLLSLEQQLQEKDRELMALRESLIRATEQSSGEAAGESSEPPPDAPDAVPDFMDETQEEETTLVAEDTSALSVSAENESSPELIGPQSESPEESKVTSSDEMVASSDSEVAHSSWTLLEAVNQDGGQEWPSVLQDFNQSWVATSIEQETSSVQVESSSVVIRETVEVHVSSQAASSELPGPSGLFAQALAEELQKRYSELLAELQRLREATAESRERIRSLEEETESLTAARDEAESRASRSAEELRSAREELDHSSQQNGSLVDKHGVEMRLVEEQVDLLHAENKSKEQQIQALQTDLEIVRQALSEQEGQARMLSAQLEDRELLSSELERRLRDMEDSMLAFSQTSDLNNESMSQKDLEISELQLRLGQKEQELTDLSTSMSARLLQAEDEKSQIDGEVSKLKDEIIELKKVRDEAQQASAEVSAARPEDELDGLRKEKGALETQLANTKKRLQAALVQRKELMRKVAEFEDEAKKQKDETPQEETPESVPQIETPKGHEIQEMEAKLVELEQALRSKEEAVETLELRIIQQDQVLAETLAENKKLSEEAESSPQGDVSSETAALQSQVASLQAECETLHKKVQEAQESRKETIRKAKEKDRHHREQLKQQKEEYGELMERFEAQSGEREALLSRLRDLEAKPSSDGEDAPQEKQEVENAEKPAAANDWVQEDWVDFAASETDSSQTQSSDPVQLEESLKALREEVQTVRLASEELEKQLEETQQRLSAKEAEVSDVSKELLALREKEQQIDALSEEITDLREKLQRAESDADALKAQVEAAAGADSAASVAALQSEVEDFKQFLDKKNSEITELSQQLGEQNSLIHAMQDTVSQKDEVIASLQQELKAEQEKTQRLEVESPQKQEDDGESKMQQLQRKLQAALISRKEVLKENKTQKEQLESSEKTINELQQKIDAAEDKLEKLQGERVRLIEEVDRALMENQSLGSSCESLKLAMENVLGEKDACKREAELAREEASRACREWEEKVQGMKDEYEMLLKSYENVSDEAERVRRVLEAARQERQELAAKVRSHEAARQEAERQAEESQKEVDSVKDKMRKFAKTKQQKILELEEENERLRELQEKPAGKREDRTLRAEVRQLQEELEALKAELETAVTERNSLGLQVEELREQLAQKGEKDGENSVDPLKTAGAVEEVIAPQESHAEPTASHEEETEQSSASQGDQLTADSAPEALLQPDRETAEVTEKAQTVLEDKMKAMEEAVEAEREEWQRQEAELKAELASLQRELQEMTEKQSLVDSLEKRLQDSKDRERGLTEEASKREAQFKDLLRGLEAEKDNLEERLMNQLAQLNGSIAGYQQEAADQREQLAELRRQAERLERERAELEAEAQSERDRAGRLEEDMRQARRERAEAEAESGKQRELEQQLRSAQRVKEGSQSRARQLEELLREKQLEVRQLQKDSIQYQERISELGRDAKALQISNDALSSNLEKSQSEVENTLEELRRTAAELADCKSQLEETQRRASDASAAKTSLEKSIQEREAALKAEAEQTLDSVRFRLGAELKEMELRLEESYRERDKEEEATLEAREVAEGAERRAQETQTRLDETLARLTAFSRCMSSLQDDRDRVLDEARQWESRFNGALQAKEAEIREAEARAKELGEQLQKETALREELLEKASSDWQLALKEEEKKVAESLAALEEESGKLLETTAQLEAAQSQAQVLKGEAESLQQRSRALEEAVSRLQGGAEQARAELRDREAEERRLCLSLEQLETDLRSSKTLTENLQSELQLKEQREVELLGEKEQAVTQAAEEARKEADERAREAEEELERKRGEVRDLGENLRKAEEESNNSKVKLDSFMKAMGSLQDDRDRVLNMYRQLEEKHLQVMMEKDGLIQEAAGENNSLKEELRSLLVQRDDLFAERAKLAAQLHNYREELNQVLSMKESQHRQLLAAQRERVEGLERQRRELEGQLKSLSLAREAEVQAVESQALSQAPQAIDAPGAEVEKLREQLQAARERAEGLEETLRREREEQESRNKELAELRWEGGVMRTESESAQERVSELALDLLAVEQKLLEEREAAGQLRAEKESMSRAMASLQDSRDQALSRLQELSLKLEEAGRPDGPPAASSPPSATGEVWGLKNALQALQNDRERLVSSAPEQTLRLQELFEEKRRNEDVLGVVSQLESVVEMGKQENETLRLERVDWMAQAEQLKQQTLATLSERDQQLRQLTAMLEDARAHQPKLQQHRAQRAAAQVPCEGSESSSRRFGPDTHTHECTLSASRLDEETQQRMTVEEQLMVTQEQLKRYRRNYSTQPNARFLKLAVCLSLSLSAPPQTRRGGRGLVRMLRVAFCSRQRTPLLLSLYLLTVHVLLLLCLGGFL